MTPAHPGPTLPDPALPEVHDVPAADTSRIPRLGAYQRLRASLKGLTTRSPFWHSALTMVFMPAVWRSGIRMRLMPDHFQAVLPFNRNNRNYDGNVSGAALLGSCEVAAGGYVFYACAGQFLVVCKKLSYAFRRPCAGPVEYRVHLHDQLEAMVAAARPFTIDLDVDVFALETAAAPRRQIGTATATFNARPIGYLRSRERRRSGTPA